MKINWRELVESSSVAIVLLFVFLPVRVFFVRFVSDDWLGSFGLITLVSVILIVLAKKNKIGWFGRAYLRQLFKANRGKRKYFFYTNLIVGTLFLGVTIYAINLGQDQYQEMVIEIKEQIPYDNMEEMYKETREEIELEDIPKGLLVFVLILFTRFDLFAVLMTTLDDLSDGWILHFSTIFLVEGLEMLGLLLYYRFTVKKPQS